MKKVGRPVRLDKPEYKLIRVNVEIHAALVQLAGVLGTTVAGAVKHLVGR